MLGPPQASFPHQYGGVNMPLPCQQVWFTRVMHRRVRSYRSRVTPRRRQSKEQCACARWSRQNFQVFYWCPKSEVRNHSLVEIDNQCALRQGDYLWIWWRTLLGKVANYCLIEYDFEAGRWAVLAICTLLLFFLRFFSSHYCGHGHAVEIKGLTDFWLISFSFLLTQKFKKITKTFPVSMHTYNYAIHAYLRTKWQRSRQNKT